MPTVVLLLILAAVAGLLATGLLRLSRGCGTGNLRLFGNGLVLLLAGVGGSAGTLGAVALVGG